MKRNKKIILLCGILLCISLAAFGVSRYEEKKEFIRCIYEGMTDCLSAVL